jgi:2-polyprenyl-3-methyl-5-hydroxy-6-metoxy-1,4-benzoquinol methylase
MKNPLNDKDLLSVAERYKKRIEEFGVTFDSLKSGSVEKQMLRHSVHLDSFRTENPSVLDIGCGLGSFYVFLEDKLKFEYTGIDIIPEYIDYCKANYTNCSFELKNVFETGIGANYDNIVLSQVLNNRYKDSDNMAVLERMMEMCFEKANVGVSIDLMSDYVDFKIDDLYYYSPEKVFSLARKFTKRVMLRHDYRPFEFCVQLYKENVGLYI